MSTKQTQPVAQRRRVHYVLNNESVPRLTIRQLFDARRYSQLTAVTGELEADFFNNHLSDFVTIDIALGANKTDDSQTADEVATKNALTTALLAAANKQPARLFETLSSQNQLNVLNGVFNVYQAPVQALHSRFYLLSDDAGQETRVILGSINLNEASFDEQHNQLEEVLIFDNSPLYDSFMQRFKDDFRPVLKNYFSAELLSAAQKQLDAMKRDQKAGKSVGNVIILDNETTDQIAVADMTNLLAHDVQQQIDRGVVKPEITKAMRDITTDRAIVKDELERSIHQHDAIYSLQKDSVSPRAAKPTLKTREKIYKRVRQTLISDMTPQERVAEKKYQTFLYDRPMERNLVNDNSGLYVPNDAGTYPIPFGKLATITEIRDSLNSINAVMQGYAKYVVDYSDDYGRRFYEAILYSFTAPFLWEIRSKASLNPEDGNDVPNFLVLGATAGSGKSTLLRIINQLTWNTDRSLIDFGSIYPSETSQKKLKTVQALEHYMKTGSTYPVLVDEIEPYFFQQDQYSRHLVVDTMNDLVNHPHAVAPLIGTTNYDSGFTMLRETARRTYYLQIDKVIDEAKKEDANKYIYNVRQTLNNTLFKDFVIRMAALLSDDETPWRIFDKETGRLDFLANTRQIFKKYYEMAGLPVPACFADTICDDFKESSRNRWAKLYITQSDDFKYHAEKKSLLFDISKLNTFNGFSADSIEEYRNALPVEVCVDGINGKRGKFMEMKASAFFKWIGVSNPYFEEVTEEQTYVPTAIQDANKPVKKKKGFWARLFG